MRVWLTFAALAMLSCSRAQATKQPEPGNSLGRTSFPPRTRFPGQQPVDVEMSHVDLHVTGDITLHVRPLLGRFVPTERAEMPYLDDKTRIPLRSTPQRSHWTGRPSMR